MILDEEYFLKDVNNQYKVAAFYLMQPEKFQDLFHEQTSIIPLHDGDVYDCNLKKY